MSSQSKCLAMLVALTFMTPLISLSAAQVKGDPITVVSHVDIIPDAYRPQSEESAGKLLRSQSAATRQDDGLVSYVVLQQNGATNHFTIVETWRDSRSYEKHEGAAHTVDFRKEIQPFLGGPIDSREHHDFH